MVNNEIAQNRYINIGVTESMLPIHNETMFLQEPISLYSGRRQFYN